MDSSSIASTALKCLPRVNSSKLKVFSAIFPDLDSNDRIEVDELAYIETILEGRAFEPTFINVSRLNPLIDNKILIQVLDEPYLAPTLYMFWGLFRSAQDAGVRVLLDGTDGDTTVSHGYEYLIDLTRTFRWYRMWKEASVLNREQKSSNSVHQTMWRYGFRPLVPPGLVDLKRKIFTRPRRGSRSLNIINPDFARQQGYEGRLDPGRPPKSKGPITARHKHWAELTSGLNALTLEIFDKSAAFHQIEMRFPFYDRRLIEFCLALPPEQKLNHGRTRYILRAAMEGVLPSQVQWRTTKSNLSLAFSRQFAGIERQELDRMIYRTKEILGAFINREAVDQAYHSLNTNTPGHIYDSYMLFGTINLADWMIIAGL